MQGNGYLYLTIRIQTICVNTTINQPDTESEVEDYLKKQYEDIIEHVEQVHKEDLKMPNHLLGLKRTFIKLSFRSVRELLTIRKIIMPVIKRNENKTDMEVDALITTTE